MTFVMLSGLRGPLLLNTDEEPLALEEVDGDGDDTTPARHVTAIHLRSGAVVEVVGRPVDVFSMLRARAEARAPTPAPSSAPSWPRGEAPAAAATVAIVPSVDDLDAAQQHATLPEGARRFTRAELDALPPHEKIGLQRMLTRGFPVDRGYPVEVPEAEDAKATAELDQIIANGGRR